MSVFETSWVYLKTDKCIWKHVECIWRPPECIWKYRISKYTQPFPNTLDECIWTYNWGSDDHWRTVAAPPPPPTVAPTTSFGSFFGESNNDIGEIGIGVGAIVSTTSKVSSVNKNKKKRKIDNDIIKHRDKFSHANLSTKSKVFKPKINKISNSSSNSSSSSSSNSSSSSSSVIIISISISSSSLVVVEVVVVLVGGGVDC